PVALGADWLSVLASAAAPAGPWLSPVPPPPPASAGDRSSAPALPEPASVESDETVGRRWSPARPLWLPAADAAGDDPGARRTALRRVLGGRYDAHARVVAKALAEQPGLRAVALAGGDVTTGLIALRAYLDSERDALNAGLRGESEEDPERIELLAREAVLGLRRLPPVFGPVYRSVPAAREVLAGYRPGEELVEPAFLDGDRLPSAPGGGEMEVAIWSAGAHRLSGLGAAEGAVLFAPGSRFAVLAVDENDGVPVRVLLRELSAARARRPARPAPPDSVDRILSKLRETPRRRPPARAEHRTMFAPGLDAAGRPYRDRRDEGGTA
ncbi:hypothetical protein AB0J83_49340, partial [Actinoplanes sp. NPDC049596]